MILLVEHTNLVSIDPYWLWVKCRVEFLVLTREKTGSWHEIDWLQKPQIIQQTNHSCNYNGKQSVGVMKAKTGNVWVQEMLESIFKRSNVKSRIQSLYMWDYPGCPRSSRSSATVEKRKERSAKVLVGERLLFFFTPFRDSLSRVSKRKKPLAPCLVKDSCVQINVLQRLFWVNGWKKALHTLTTFASLDY